MHAAECACCPGTVMQATQTVTAELRDAPARDRKLALEQLGLALRSLQPNAWLMPLLAAVICLLFYRWIAMPRLIVWFVMVLTTGIPLGIACNRFGDTRPGAPASSTQIRLST